ncbi:2432_t:CDS:2, partial [Racocetra fulgida]
LRRVLNETFHEKSWDERYEILLEISLCISKLHDVKIIHKNLHSGNILLDRQSGMTISDLGLCKPLDNENSKDVYGVIPYVAPELPKETPPHIKKLLSKCLDANPEGRPTMQQIHKKLDSWKHKIRDNPSSNVYKEFQLANEDWKKNSSSKKLNLTIHEKAVYKSQILKFKTSKPINAINGMAKISSIT